MAEPPTEPAPARPAASLVLMRRGGRHRSTGLELLMGRRSSEASFMPGIWVFPGGRVETGETAEAAAMRELEEEAGVALPDETELFPWARWITPYEVPVRFDTLFFAALAPAHVKPEPDGGEIVDVRWIAPLEALDAAESGELAIVFPTVKQLEVLVTFESPQDLIDHVRENPEPPAILPRIVGAEGERRMALPGDPDYPSFPEA